MNGIVPTIMDLDFLKSIEESQDIKKLIKLKQINEERKKEKNAKKDAEKNAKKDDEKNAKKKGVK